MWKILYFLNNYKIAHSIIDNNDFIEVKINDYIITNEGGIFRLKKNYKTLLRESKAEYFINCLDFYNFKKILKK